MSRVYIQASWVGAAEDWSGDSPDNRKCSSRELYLPNGKANTKAFADEAPKPNAKKKRSIVERVSLADSHYNRLEALSLELDKELENGNVSLEDYAYLRQVMDSRLEKAWNRLAKARGFIDDNLEGLSEAYSHNSYRQNVDFDSKNPSKQSVFSSVSIDYSKVGMPAVFDNLKDDNFLKQIAFWVLTARQAIAKILPTATK
jgi:hypothetical protein